MTPHHKYNALRWTDSKISLSASVYDNAHVQTMAQPSLTLNYCTELWTLPMPTQTLKMPISFSRCWAILSACSNSSHLPHFLGSFTSPNFKFPWPSHPLYLYLLSTPRQPIERGLAIFPPPCKSGRSQWGRDCDAVDCFPPTCSQVSRFCWELV